MGYHLFFAPQQGMRARAPPLAWRTNAVRSVVALAPLPRRAVRPRKMRWRTRIARRMHRLRDLMRPRDARRTNGIAVAP